MFVRNLAAFTEALGVENAPTILALSVIPWQSDDDRNQFIKQLSGRDLRQVGQYGS